MSGELNDFLKTNDVEFKQNYNLGTLSKVKIGGEARYLCYVKSVNELINLVEFLHKSKTRYKILGRMSNVLVSDEGFDGVVIKTDRLSGLKCCDDIIVAECGVSLPALAWFSAKRGLSGIEALSGIPGSLGAGIMINAGAFGREIGEVVESVLVYSVAEGDIIRLGAEEIKFNYRSTSLTNSFVFLSATIKLSYSSSLEVFSEMNRIREVRRAAQPSLPSLGSVFKRPNSELSAGKLVDLCGLKGYKCGGAQISEKHAGFIVNQGNATAKDYLFLMEYTRECVFSRFGIKLENEVEIMEY